ncbi:ATP synthase F0 subunit 6 (mitochondrion) [Mizuhopecten yessoensis]|uniref:ATP synthase subunit a n=1 Tax=Mizuhopecten yessoensis TaxID=6573 RepID=A3KCM5_MIZYE|nr:ATP synthase subunit 6 [Mizuhopecten yessoensis]ACL36043.1 ATP synthase subunit 6 [Mizuhopecten yessoensis]BAF47969.1 ATP synthase F0 subunit 6 [Mizuhopecten yessoensis]
MSFHSYFSQFDWSFSLGTFLALCLPFFILSLVSSPFFMSAGLLETAFTWGALTASKAFLKSPFGKKAGGAHLMVFLGCVLFSVNFLGMVPFLKGASTSPSFVFFYALFFWSLGTLGSFIGEVGFIRGVWVKGSPFSLNLVVVASEILSWLIRPVVLGFRLLVNVVCGHVMLAIIGEASMFLVWEGHWFFVLVSILGGWLIGLLEWLIMVVQTAIFMGLVGWSWSSSPKAPRSSAYWFFGFLHLF